jgi:hypothetical protein
VGYCCPSGLEKTLFNWDRYVYCVMINGNMGIKFMNTKYLEFTVCCSLFAYNISQQGGLMYLGF